MSSKCQRCTRANRECVYTTHSKTRRRKRTDTRVKELEEKVRGLSMLLESKTANSNQSSAEMDALESTEFDLEETRDPNEYPSRGGYGGATEDGFSPLGLPTPPHSLKGAEAVIHAFGQGRDLSHSQNKDLSDPSPIFPDVIDRGILSMEKATELHSKYVNDLQPMYVTYINDVLPPRPVQTETDHAKVPRGGASPRLHCSKTARIQAYLVSRCTRGQRWGVKSSSEPETKQGDPTSICYQSLHPGTQIIRASASNVDLYSMDLPT